jgi:hypothetical protein
MSPPEVWGPPIWTLFHMLAEKIDENAYQSHSSQLFSYISRICRFLPCPECSKDATQFLDKIKIQNIKDKQAFKGMLFLFHNHVNAKKRKPLFKYENMDRYKYCRVVSVINRFIAVYNTKGNLQQINESFQRQFVIKDFKSWLMSNIRVFITNPIPQLPPPNPVSEKNEANNSS